MKLRRFFTLGMFIISMAIQPVFSSNPALAGKTWVVNTLSDVALGSCSYGSCSLRDAIALSASGDTITFSVNGTIYLNHGGLTISKNLTISGPGANILMVTGVRNYQVFHIAAGKAVTLSGLTITDGKSSNGGGSTMRAR